MVTTPSIDEHVYVQNIKSVEGNYSSGMAIFEILKFLNIRWW